MMSWIKIRWLALGDATGMILAVPAAALFGLLMIWFLPYTRQIGWEHYRLTATFEVDGRTVTASQVYAYQCFNMSERFPAARCRIRGEAMTVDLGKRGKIFFVMNQWNADHTALASADYMILRLKLSAQRDGRPTWNNLPALVRFKDEANPETAEFVDPRDLETDYGEGAVLTRFTVTRTVGLENKGAIQTVLPWVSNPHIDALGKSGSAAQLHAFDFKWPPA